MNGIHNPNLLKVVDNITNIVFAIYQASRVSANNEALHLEREEEAHMFHTSRTKVQGALLVDEVTMMQGIISIPTSHPKFAWIIAHFATLPLPFHLLLNKSWHYFSHLYTVIHINLGRDHKAVNQYWFGILEPILRQKCTSVKLHMPSLSLKVDLEHIIRLCAIRSGSHPRSLVMLLGWANVKWP